MSKDQKRNLTGIHVDQYEFWSKLQQTNPSVYKNDIQGLQFYDLPITKNGWIIRLDIYFLKQHYKKKGSLTIAVMNDDKNLFDTKKEPLMDYFEKEGLSSNVDLYKNKYHRMIVAINNNDYFLENHQNWGNAITWFNDHITNLISML